MAISNNYRENRWFKPWVVDDGYGVVDFELPEAIRDLTGQKSVKFGNAVVKCRDTEIASEICEEVWVTNNPHIEYYLSGVEIISNASASHHTLRKLDFKLDLIKHVSATHGGVYMYSNLKGCDGGRLYFDGASMVAMNGKVYAQAPQFSVDDIEVQMATLDLEEVRNMRRAMVSRPAQASKARTFPHVFADINICSPVQSLEDISLVSTFNPVLDPLEEIAQAPALWTWDYLRRSGARGFFLPLSGGADSAAVATIVASMSKIVFESIQGGNAETLATLRRIVKNEKFTPAKYQDIVNQLLVTCYLGTKNSSAETLGRSKRVAEALGSHHFEIGIDEAYDSIKGIFEKATGKFPKYTLEGGSYTEDLALQNIQARTRMVISYLMAQLVPWTRSESGFLLVLGTSNIAEGLRGYMTKYDCSAADINPIGGINKTDIKAFLEYFAKQNDIPVLAEVAGAKPSAELRPQEGDSI